MNVIIVAQIWQIQRKVNFWKTEKYLVNVPATKSIGQKRLVYIFPSTVRNYDYFEYVKFEVIS